MNNFLEVKPTTTAMTVADLIRLLNDEAIPKDAPVFFAEPYDESATLPVMRVLRTPFKEWFNGVSAEALEEAREIANDYNLKPSDPIVVIRP